VALADVKKRRITLAVHSGALAIPNWALQTDLSIRMVAVAPSRAALRKDEPDAGRNRTCGWL